MTKLMPCHPLFCQQNKGSELELYFNTYTTGVINVVGAKMEQKQHTDEIKGKNGPLQNFLDVCLS